MQDTTILNSTSVLNLVEKITHSVSFFLTQEEKDSPDSLGHISAKENEFLEIVNDRILLSVPTLSCPLVFVYPQKGEKRKDPSCSPVGRTCLRDSASLCYTASYVVLSRKQEIVL